MFPTLIFPRKNCFERHDLLQFPLSEKKKRVIPFSRMLPVGSVRVKIETIQKTDERSKTKTFLELILELLDN
jgi:hypothetical protein